MPHDHAPWANGVSHELTADIEPETWRESPGIHADGIAFCSFGHREPQAVRDVVHELHSLHLGEDRGRAASWLRLPDHLTRDIVSRLFVFPAHRAQTAAASARLVCRAWAEEVAAACTELVLRRRLPGLGGAPRRGVLDVFPNLETLDATGARLGPLLLPAGAPQPAKPGAPALRSLRLGHRLCEDIAGQLSGVEVLDVEFSGEVDYADIGWYRSLALLTALKALTLSPQKLDDTAARGMAPVASRLEAFCCPNMAFLGDSGFEALRFSPALLKSLRLRKCRHFKRASLAALVELTSLRELALESAPLTTECVAMIARSLPFLTVLDLEDCWRLGDKAVEALLPLAGTLRRLCFSGTGISDDALRHIANFQGLSVLEIAFTDVCDDGLKHLEPLAGTLELLNLDNTCVSGYGLLHLKHFTALTDLVIDDTPAAADGVLAATDGVGFPALKYLYAAQVSEDAGNPAGWVLTDDHMDALASLHQLRQLTLHGNTVIASRGAAAITCLTGLRRLGLKRTGVCGDGLAMILGGGDLKHLWELELEQCEGVDDDVLSQGLDLPALRVLNLSNCMNLGDAGLTSLRPLSKTLEALHLKGCERISDVGVAALEPLSALQDIDLRRCTGVTATGVSALQGLPNIKSIYLHGTAVSIFSEAFLSVPRAFAACLNIKTKSFSPWWQPAWHHFGPGIDTQEVDGYESSSSSEYETDEDNSDEDSDEEDSDEDEDEEF